MMPVEFPFHQTPRWRRAALVALVPLGVFFAFVDCSSRPELDTSRAATGVPDTPAIPCALNAKEFRDLQSAFDGKPTDTPDLPGIFRCVRTAHGAASGYTSVSMVRVIEGGLPAGIAQGAFVRGHRYVVFVYDRLREPLLSRTLSKPIRGSGPDIVVGSMPFTDGRTAAQINIFHDTLFHSVFPDRRNQRVQLRVEPEIRVVVPPSALGDLRALVVREFDPAELVTNDCPPGAAPKRIDYSLPLCVCQAKVVPGKPVPANPFEALQGQFSKPYRVQIAGKMLENFASGDDGWAIERNGPRNQPQQTCDEVAEELWAQSSKALKAGAQAILRSQWDRDLPPEEEADIGVKVDASLLEALELFRFEVGLKLQLANRNPDLPAGWNAGYCAFFPNGLRSPDDASSRKLIPMRKEYSFSVAEGEP